MRNQPFDGIAMTGSVVLLYRRTDDGAILCGVVPEFITGAEDEFIIADLTITVHKRFKTGKRGGWKVEQILCSPLNLSELEPVFTETDDEEDTER